MFYTALVYKEEEDFVAECVEFEIASQGRTKKEAVENLKEAVELYLEENPDAKKRIKASVEEFEVHNGIKA